MIPIRKITRQSNIPSIAEVHINDIKELEKAIDITKDEEFVNINYKCANLKNVLNTLKDDIENVLKKDKKKIIGTLKWQPYVDAIYKIINDTLDIIPDILGENGKKRVSKIQFEEDAPKVERNKLLFGSIEGDSVSNSLESILKPLIKEGKQQTVIPINSDFYKAPNDNIKSITRQSEEPGIIMILLKLCTEVCPNDGGKSRRRSRKNKRTRKSKKKARRSKKARKTRK